MTKPKPIPDHIGDAIYSGPVPTFRDWRALSGAQLTRGERVCRFIERYCRCPEGEHVGKPLVLSLFQVAFILAVYDNPVPTRLAILSVGRKNGKTSLIAGMLLAHTIGPEAVLNSQIASGANARDQAAKVYMAAEKMILLNPELGKLAKPTPSRKQVRGLARNVEYEAISAEAKTAHGGSPVLAILDEIGQIKGPYSAFVEAIETSQGAYEEPLRVYISTQAATDGDLLSIAIDDAKAANDPRIVCHVYTAPDECELLDQDAWRAANPGMGEFRSVTDLEALAEQAARMPSKENSFRWLYLNQRIEADAPFISKAVWEKGNSDPGEIDGPVFAGLDLSEVSDLTAFVAISPVGEKSWGVYPTFWLPGEGLRDKAKADRVPYDLWHKQERLMAAPGPTVDYEFVADWLRGFCDSHDVRRIAFDRWNYRHLKPWLKKVGFDDLQLDGDAAVFVEFGQGYKSMSPALRDLEGALLKGEILHGDHPVMSMCARNARVKPDPAGNRKFIKPQGSAKIDGMVALAMALSVAVDDRGEAASSPWDDPNFSLVVG